MHFCVWTEVVIDHSWKCRQDFGYDVKTKYVLKGLGSVYVLEAGDKENVKKQELLLG